LVSAVLTTIRLYVSTASEPDDAVREFCRAHAPRPAQPAARRLTRYPFWPAPACRDRRRGLAREREACARRAAAPNAARFVFLDPRAREFCLDWDRIARDVVATLRSAAGRTPYDRDLTDLVGELSTRSQEFRQHWAKHDVRFHISGVKRFCHREVGDLELNYERLEVVFDTGLTIFTYTADPGTRSADALGLLGSLAATTAAAEQSTTP
jgi:hypothetical protein